MSVVFCLACFICSPQLKAYNGEQRTSFGGYSVTMTGIAHLDTALMYSGVREVGNNDGYYVRKFLISVGLRAGNPYCAAFVSYCLNAVRSAFPIRSGLARKFKTKKSISALDVMRGWKTAKAGSLVGWEKKNSISGHIGFVRKDWKGRSGKTLEANTPPGNTGDQRDAGSNGGVYPRDREIKAIGLFKITFFTEVK